MLLHKDGTSEGKSVAKRFEASLKYVDRVDVLVGFFYFSGLGVVEEALRAHPEVRMRVLVGMRAELVMGQVAEVAWDGRLSPEERARDTVRQLEAVLGSGVADRRSFLARVGFFLELLTSGRLEVRQTAKPNHAKVWLFHHGAEHAEALGEGKWIVGSSNFTYPALASEMQAELDAEIHDWGYGEAQAYFDALWETAHALDVGVVEEVLRRRCALTPFEAYALALDTVVRHTPENPALDRRITQALRRAGFGDFAYQRDAVAQACAMLEQYHGVLLADVVGLGKSVIASVIASVAPTGRYGLILCPPGLVANWREYRERFGLGQWRVFSSGNLEKVKRELELDPGYSMVVVDEAHRFRNATTRAYADLHTICAGRDVVLLTATPLNNRVEDIEALLLLFLSGKQCELVYGGDLQGWFSRASGLLKACQEAAKLAAYWGSEEEKQVKALRKHLKNAGIELLRGLKSPADVRVAIEERRKEILKHLKSLLSKVTIRRNRLDLTEDPVYAASLPPLSTVKDPRAMFFELNPEQSAFYDDMMMTCFGGMFPRWHGPVYRPSHYATKNGSTGVAQGNIHKIMQRMLARRFESSFRAFRISLENMREMYRMVKAFALRTGMIFYDRELMEELLESADDGDFAARLMRACWEQQETETRTGLDKVYRLDDPTFNDRAFWETLEEDLALFDKTLKRMKTLRLEERDPKAGALAKFCEEVLKGALLRDSAPGAPKRKILIFSEFADTVTAIAEGLERHGVKRVFVVRELGGEVRRTLRANFDASLPKTEQCDDYDILVGTDKISEGLNLNRAGVVVNYDIPWNPTRVLQRLGRINRIGQKVFNELYPVNFFPTELGASLVRNYEIAQRKLFAIQTTLGEDVKLFEAGEEPTAATLWERLNALPDEVSPIVVWRRRHQALEVAHPGLMERVRRHAPRAKAAWVSDMPHALWQLHRHGLTLNALVCDEGSHLPREISPLELLEAIKCEQDTPGNATELTQKPFWETLKAMEEYTPALLKMTAQQSQVCTVLCELRPQLPEAADALEAITAAFNEGRLAPQQVNLLAKLSAETPEKLAVAKKEIGIIHKDLRLAGSREARAQDSHPVVSIWR